MATSTNPNIPSPLTSNPSNPPEATPFTEYLHAFRLPNFIHSLSTTTLPKTTQYFALATTPSVPAYSIKVRAITHGKPDIELHLGTDLNSPIAAVGRLHLRRHEFGIPPEFGEKVGLGNGDGNVGTKDGIGEEFMTWENLNRVTKWTERVYGFYWGIGRERKEYTWLRVKPMGMMGMGDMRELELRVGGREEAENGGEVLARWVRGKGVKTLKRGSLFVRKSGDGGKEKRWEGVVMITFLMILEIFVRKGGG